MRLFLKVSLILTLLAVFVVPALAQTSIAPGDTVTGTLTTDEPSASYTLNAEAGQAVTITLSSEAFDAYLTLQDGDGNVLAENDDDPSRGTDSTIQSFVLPSASSYTILVESYGQHGNSGAETGDYTLSVTEQQIEHIEYSQSIQGQLTSDELSKDYVFTGQAGDVVVITENSDDFDSYLHLLDSTGNELTSNDDSGSSLNSMIGPYTLPNSGNYTIRATSLDGTVSGSFTLTLNKTEVTAMSYNEPVEVNFTPNAQAKYFTFEGTSGDLVSISVDSGSSIDTSLSLTNSYNSQIATDEDSGSGFDPEIFQQLLSSTGTYTVALTAVAPGTGTVTLTIKSTPPPSLDEGTQTVSFTSSQTSRAVMFTGKAGEKVQLTLHAINNGVGSPSITVMQGDSTVANASGSSVSDMSFSFAPSSDGAVVVQISDYSYSNLSYEVSLARPGE